MSKFETSPYRKRSRNSISPERDSYKKDNSKDENFRKRCESPLKDTSTRRSPERRYKSREDMNYKKYKDREVSPARRTPSRRLSPLRRRSPDRDSLKRARSPREVRGCKKHRDKDVTPSIKESDSCNLRRKLKSPESSRRETNYQTNRDRSPYRKAHCNQIRRRESPSRKQSSCKKICSDEVENVQHRESSPNRRCCSPKKKRFENNSDSTTVVVDQSTEKDVTSQNANSSLRCSDDDKDNSKEKYSTKQEKDFHTIRKEYLRNQESITGHLGQNENGEEIKLGAGGNEKQLSQAESIETCLSLQFKAGEKSSFHKSHCKILLKENEDNKYKTSEKTPANSRQDLVSMTSETAYEKYSINETSVAQKENNLVLVESNEIIETAKNPNSNETHKTNEILEEADINAKKSFSNEVKQCQRKSKDKEIDLRAKESAANTTIIKKEKQASVSDSNSVEDGSQSNDGIENIEDEISEESRLIQLNPALREFDILDDLEGSDHEDDGEAQQSNSSEDESDLGEELPVEDVDAMLEEGLPDKFKDSGKDKEHTIKLKRKMVLEEIGYDHFDLLPEGWIQIMHNSGMPVYLHQKSRVCTMARPYYLGPGSSRNHKVPLSAIPCLQYRRALEVEKKNAEEKEKRSEKQNQNQSEIQLMSAKIETSEENEAAQSLEALDLREYCKKVFNFKTITLIPFKSWADRRKYVRMTKDLKKRQRPSLPGGTKLLKFPIQNPDGTNCRSKGEWIINPNGKSYVCILHEYVQHALRKHPKYQFKELENPATPYSATVFIGDMQYSVGMGASKKQAKVEAAKAALEVLIPEMKEKIERDSQFGMRSGIVRRSQNTDISIFDQIRVEDPRVAEFCAKTTEPPPYAILLTCLSRNMGLGDIKVQYEMNSKKHKEDEFTMVVGSHTATVVCKNKRDGKQRAAQAILQALHPNITHWGSLLRMYGNRSIKNVKEKKQEEQEITGLQSKASLNQPNFAILEKLRTEMLKLKGKRDAIKAKGKFTPPENVILPSLSSTDLNKVNLS